jgi:hypothetical protein
MPAAIANIGVPSISSAVRKMRGRPCHPGRWGWRRRPAARSSAIRAMRCSCAMRCSRLLGICPASGQSPSPTPKGGAGTLTRAVSACAPCSVGPVPAATAPRSPPPAPERHRRWQAPACRGYGPDGTVVRVRLDKRATGLPVLRRDGAEGAARPQEHRR